MNYSFEKYMEMLKTHHKDNNISISNSISETEYNKLDEFIGDIPDETILDDIYKQMNTSTDKIKSFSLVDELYSIIGLMREPEEGTYEYELYTKKMGFLMFLEKYDEDIARIEDKYNGNGGYNES